MSFLLGNAFSINNDSALKNLMLDDAVGGL
jgi:hypothetical protein